MTTKRNRRAWAIGLSLFATLLVIGIMADAFGTPTAATKTDPAVATPFAAPVAGSCRQQVTAWRGSAGDTYFRHAAADAARLARIARAHQGAGLRRDGAALAAAVHGAAAHPVPSCLDSHAYYGAAMTDLSAAAGAAAQGSSGAALRWVRAARRLVTRVNDELTPAHRRHHHAARPAASAPAPATSPAGSSAPAQRCYPLSDEGTCYEPGEYCRDSDQGVAGIAGDGQTIVCEDNDGLRWEPTG
jgi:hypothetical protein